MPATQQLLLPDPQPLVERLGRELFRSLPAVPGVYLMRDSSGTVLYVGKAKSLRQRLAAYRTANPGRMKRRHLRLLGAAATIETELCADEATALAREAELILSLRPRFNRAGTWPIAQRYVVWRILESHLEIAIAKDREDGWLGIGPVGSGRAKRLRAALVRLLWLIGYPQYGFADMPVGWARGIFGPAVSLPVEKLEAICPLLDDLAAGSSEGFCDCASERLADVTNLTTEFVGRDLDAVRRIPPGPA